MGQQAEGEPAHTQPLRIIGLTHREKVFLRYERGGNPWRYESQTLHSFARLADGRTIPISEARHRRAERGLIKIQVVQGALT